MGREGKDHTVSKFYLNGFADRSLDKGDVRYLWVYEKGKSLVRKASTREVAHVRDFYHVTRTNGSADIHLVEKALKQLESEVAPVLRMIEREVKLTGDERALFAMFLAVMIVRVPNYRDAVRRQVVLGLQKELMEADREPRVFEEKMRGLMRGTGSSETVNVKEAREILASDGLKRAVSSDVWHGSLTDIAKEIAKAISEMNWIFIRSVKGCRFITSDNPVYFNTPDRNPKHAYSSGIRTKSAELTFPISRDWAFISTWDNRRWGTQTASKKLIGDINFRTVVFAARHIYASFYSSTFNSTFIQKYTGSEPEF